MLCIRASGKKGGRPLTELTPETVQKKTWNQCVVIIILTILIPIAYTCGHAEITELKSQINLTSSNETVAAADTLYNCENYWNKWMIPKKRPREGGTLQGWAKIFKEGDQLNKSCNQ